MKTLKVWLTCPACRRKLPPIDAGIVLEPGQTVECGLCGHKWVPSQKEKQTT